MTGNDIHCCSCGARKVPVHPCGICYKYTCYNCLSKHNGVEWCKKCSSKMGLLKKLSLTRKEINKEQCNYSCYIDPYIRTRKPPTKPNPKEKFIPLTVLHEAKKEYDNLSGSNMDEHYFNVIQWIKKWFGDKDE